EPQFLGWGDEASLSEGTARLASSAEQHLAVSAQFWV
ncbi:hypothetical protein A2U01_0079408, partial [Trifolium medium]|nr:hypothetical protein [Trifolium medium]